LHSKKPELIDAGKPFLQLNNIRNDGLLDTSEVAGISNQEYGKWISRIEVSTGDCVITNVGRVGAVAQIPSGFKAAMGRNMTAIRLHPSWPYPTYLIELLQSKWMRSEIENKTDTGTILNALNVKNIPLLRCFLATSDVMKAFEDVSRPLRAGMEENIKSANTLATLRDTLLPRLISGQLRLPEAQSQLEEAYS
jgi:type I restriction enzyme S subunit